MKKSQKRLNRSVSQSVKPDNAHANFPYQKIFSQSPTSLIQSIETSEAHFFKLLLLLYNTLLHTLSAFNADKCETLFGNQSPIGNSALLATVAPPVVRPGSRA